MHSVNKKDQIFFFYCKNKKELLPSKYDLLKRRFGFELKILTIIEWKIHFKDIKFLVASKNDLLKIKFIKYN